MQIECWYVCQWWMRERENFAPPVASRWKGWIPKTCRCDGDTQQPASSSACRGGRVGEWGWEKGDSVLVHAWEIIACMQATIRAERHQCLHSLLKLAFPFNARGTTPVMDVQYKVRAPMNEILYNRPNRGNSSLMDKKPFEANHFDADFTFAGLLLVFPPPPPSFYLAICHCVSL